MMKNFTMLLLVLVIPLFAAQAQTTVSGKVTDAAGDPLIGVSIIIDGTSTGTVTDISGNYSLNVADANASLRFSFIGYVTVTEALNGRSTINITMEEDVTQIDEVVVSALGFEQSRDDMGATISKINTEDMKRSGEANFLNSLTGKAAGIQVQRVNGDPGAGTTIKIRGANSITGNPSPLIIIDGIPVSNSTVYGGGNNVTGGRAGGTSQPSRLNDLNPNDIESVQVLKGASAAALWGSRAKNGVIVITTKNGSSGKVNISLNSSLSFDYVMERIPMQTTFGQGRNGSYSPTGVESWGDYIPDRAGGADEFDETGRYFQAEDGTIYYPIVTKNSQETYVDQNWDDVFGVGGFFQNDLSINGGSDKATYFMSISNLNQDGIIKNSGYDRTNLRLNTRFFLTDWMTVTSKAAYVTSFTNRIQQSSNTAGLLLGLLRTAPDFNGQDYKGTYYDDNGIAYPNRHRSYRRYLGNTVNPVYNNHLWTANEQTATSVLNRFTMSSEINISPKENFDITLRGGADSYTEKRDYFFPIGSGGSRSVGILAEDLITETEYNFDAIGKAQFKLASDLNLNATLGWNINDRSREILTGTITGFLVNSDKPTTQLNSSQDASVYEKSRRFIRSNRGYTVLNFGYKDALFVNLSGSAEAASSINGVFFYPAVDVAWQINEFVDLSATPISFLKLRTGYGIVGSQPAPHRFQTLAEGGFTYSTYSDPISIGLLGGGFRLDDDKGNPDLRPEIKTEWELGLDARLFEDKLGLGMTYYQNEITDILLSVDLTPSSGGDTQYANAGTMENKGFEIELDYNIFETPDFTLDAFIRWNRNRNEVTDLFGSETIDLTGQSVSSRAIVGYQLGALYGTGSLKDENGDFILDVNGFPQITSSPQVLGDPNPDWRGTLGIRAGYKGFNLSAIFQHSQGGDFMPRTLWVLRRFGTTQETANYFTTAEDLVNYNGDVVPSGTQVRGNVADFGGGNVLLDESWYRTGIGGGFGDNQAYNFALADATWTRLRELTLSYTLNSQGFRDRTKLSSITLGVTGRNLFLWDNIPGIDPEISQTGVSNGYGLDYFTNPTTRSVLFSLSINY